MHHSETLAGTSVLYEALKKFSDKKIVLSYSGNKDSYILFTALCLLKDENNLDFEIVHFVHGNSQSDLEAEKIVKSQALANNISVAIFHEPITNESQGREARQKVLEKLYPSSKFVILTAHHLDDVVETFLMNLFNGCSYSGLLGIPVQNEIGNVLYFRPFIYLNCYKKDLQVYKGRYSIVGLLDNKSFVEDSMNLNFSFKRNAIRSFINSALDSFPYLKNKIISFSLFAEQQNNINVFCYKQTDYLLSITNNSYSLSTVKHLLNKNEDAIRNWFFMLFKYKFNTNLTIRHFEEFKRFINDDATLMALPNSLSISNKMQIVQINNHGIHNAYL